MLAIIIPYYKIRFFEETLKSLENQTDMRFKVYIFNDNSPENPEKLIEKFKNSFDFEYFKFNENLGGKSLVKHWHRCLEKINEKWFSILGDDDLLSQNYVASFYDNLNLVNEKEINLVRYATNLINDEGKKIQKSFIHPEIENAVDSLIRKLEGKSRSSLSEFVYRNSNQIKSYFVEFPNAYFSDDLSILLATNFGKIFTVNESVVQIRRGSFNLSGVNSNLKKGNQSEFLFYKYLFNNHDDKFNFQQKKLFLHKLNRLIIRNKSLLVYLFVLKNQIKLNDFKGTLYFLKLVLNKSKLKLNIFLKSNIYLSK